MLTRLWVSNAFRCAACNILEKTPKVSKICFCLDYDEPGRKAADALMEKYCGLDYEVENCSPPQPFKDYNQWLQTAKWCISDPVQAKAGVRLRDG